MARSGRGRPPAGFVRHMAQGKCTSCYQFTNRRRLRVVRPLTYRGRPSTVIDQVVVERMVAGDRRVPCTTAELHEAIDRLDRYGLSARQTAERLGVIDRTVTRQRARRAERTAA